MLSLSECVTESAVFIVTVGLYLEHFMIIKLYNNQFEYRLLKDGSTPPKYQYIGYMQASVLTVTRNRQTSDM